MRKKNKIIKKDERIKDDNEIIKKNKNEINNKIKR